MIVVLSFFLPNIVVAGAKEKPRQTTSNTMVLIPTRPPTTID
jgi:hypothetical protein